MIAAVAVARLVAAVLAAVLVTGGCSVLSGHSPAAPAAGAVGAGGYRAALPFPAAENRKQGTRGWKLSQPGAQDAVEGFADHVSVLSGQSFRLYVSTTSASFRVQAFRMGWYQGTRARQVWESGREAGRVQAAPQVRPGTRMVTAPWKPSLTVSTRGWPQGAYLLRLDAVSGAQRYVPITVRSPSTAGKVVMLLGVTTWQAYNRWGGYSLYDGPGRISDRAYADSFDRPYDGSGADQFLYFNEPPIALAEHTSGVPLAYETDIDIAQDPGLLRGAAR